MKHTIKWHNLLEFNKIQCIFIYRFIQIDLIFKQKIVIWTLYRLQTLKKKQKSQWSSHKYAYGMFDYIIVFLFIFRHAFASIEWTAIRIKNEKKMRYQFCVKIIKRTFYYRCKRLCNSLIYLRCFYYFSLLLFRRERSKKNISILNWSQSAEEYNKWKENENCVDVVAVVYFVDSMTCFKTSWYIRRFGKILILLFMIIN